MERMLPIDLDRRMLRTSFRGYRKEEVDQLMQRASDALGEILTENKDMEARLAAQKKELDGFHALEETLKQALILAQKAADDTRASAHREADVIVEESRQKANDIQQQAETKLADLRWEIERLRLDKGKFVNSFRAMLETQLRDLIEASNGQLSVVEGSSSGAAQA